MIEIHKSDDQATIRIAGRFDFRCVKEFQRALVQASPTWVVDLTEVDYLDSAALGLLLLLREHAGGESAQITVRRPRGQPRDVLRMAKFDRMFAFED